MKFGCGHPAKDYNAMEYRSHGERRLRCRTCYNAWKRKYERKRAQERQKCEC